MGRSRLLMYAMNAERRRENGEERRPGLMPPAGRGIRPIVPRFEHWGGLQEENFYLHNTARGRSRPFPAPWPFIQICHRFQPHSLPRCLSGGFGGYADPNICFLRINNPLPWAQNPQQYVHPPPPPQDQESGAESSSSESSDWGGNSLEAHHSMP